MGTKFKMAVFLLGLGQAPQNFFVELHHIDISTKCYCVPVKVVGGAVFQGGGQVFAPMRAISEIHIFLLPLNIMESLSFRA